MRKGKRSRKQMISSPISKQYFKMALVFFFITLQYVESMGENLDHPLSHRDVDMTLSGKKYWEGNTMCTLIVAVAIILVSLYKFSTNAQEWMHMCLNYVCKRKPSEPSEPSEPAEPSLESQCNSNSLIGIGRYGNCIYKGTCRGDVVIKRFQKTFYDEECMKKYLKCYNEKMSSHQNIVRCYKFESYARFMYVGWERGICNLETLINNIKGQNIEIIKDAEGIHQLRFGNRYPSYIQIHLMRDMIEGLYYMHENGVIHNRLSPDNVLIVKDNARLCAKLCDPEIGSDYRTLKIEKIKIPSGCKKSAGWMSPELLKNEESCTFESDIFSLGLLLYFCITGEHVFGEVHERNNGIMKFDDKLPRTFLKNKCKNEKKKMGKMKELLMNMLKLNPEDRCKIDQIRSCSVFTAGEGAEE